MNKENNLSGSAITGLSNEEIERRIDETVPKMTLDEKLAQMAGAVTKNMILRLVQEFTNPDTWDTPANDRLNIPPLKYIDGPRGVGKGKATSFPVSILRGAAWDADLERRVGEAIGYEARALGANAVCSPCINVLRHSSWGRAQETYGEDPYHLGAMGASHVVGMQRHVMACAKHFAANSIEKSRFYVDVRMDERTLREIYLPHFRMCVDAGCATIMSAYNDLNGYLCAHNKHLLADILKDEWGFDGLVVSDWGMAVRDAVAAANAGLDVEMPTGKRFGKKLKSAVLEGKVSEGTIDKALQRILRQKFRFISPDNLSGYDLGKVGGKEHAAIALEAARKGIVLLKNEGAVLPLRRESLRKLAVIGKLADRPNLGDKGSSNVEPPYAVTPLEGIRSWAGNSINIVYDNGRIISRAKRIAKDADAVIIIAGLTWLNEGEGGYVYGDRKKLGLPKKYTKLIKAVSGENERCIVLLEGGSAITVGEWVGRVKAILMAFYPGMEGGNAIADIIFGDVNPSGKLPIVFPKSATQLFKFDSRARTVEYGYYHGYRYFDKIGIEPQFAFGFGLSYTEYNYSNLRLDKKEITKTGRIRAQADVTNTGEMAGEEIAQLYVGYKGSKVNRPVKDLKGFTRVALKPGETKTVSFDLNAQDLAYYDMQSSRWEIEEIEYVLRIGPSSREADLKLSETFGIKGS